MNLLARIASELPGCVATAAIDTRTGAVLSQHIESDDPFAAQALAVAIEAARACERPPRMVVLSERHIQILQRRKHEPHCVFVALCARSPNLGFAVALMSSLIAAEAP